MKNDLSLSNQADLFCRLFESQINELEPIFLQLTGKGVIYTQGIRCHKTC